MGKGSQCNSNRQTFFWRSEQNCFLTEQEQAPGPIHRVSYIEPRSPSSDTTCHDLHTVRQTTIVLDFWSEGNGGRQWGIFARDLNVFIFKISSNKGQKHCLMWTDTEFFQGLPLTLLRGIFVIRPVHSYNALEVHAEFLPPVNPTCRETFLHFQRTFRHEQLILGNMQLQQEGIRDTLCEAHQYSHFAA